MELKTQRIEAYGIRITHEVDGEEVGRAYLYVMTNDLHKEPFGFMEDVFVKDGHRKGGLGSVLVNKVIEEARKAGCYKIVATSRTERPKVHDLYIRLGFYDQGKEFRYDL
jgi:GNAT superfamily N-acetyltransferase